MRPSSMFRSATFQLTMWYLAIVMVISLSFSAILYHDASLELARGLNRQSARIYSQFPVFQDNPILRPGTDLHDGDHHLLLRLLILNIFVLVFAGFASYLLARRTLRPIEEAHEQQKRFTADVSHELRTPLTAIRMESEVALMSADSSNELQETLKSNLEEVGKLELLINNLLRLTRLEATELQHQFTVTPVSEVLDDALKRTEKIRQQQQVRIEREGSDQQVLADAESLSQLFVILLDNAIKYSPSGSTITLSTKKQGSNIIISVSDQGVGIPKADLEHVFDRFYRADSSRTKNGSEGYGLGLSIAKMIADLHHSSITLASKFGHGTVASVELPVIQNEAEDTPNIKPAKG